MRSRGLEVSLQTNFPGEIDRLDHRLHGFVGTLPLIVVGYDVLLEKVFEYFPEMNFFNRLLKKYFAPTAVPLSRRVFSIPSQL